jgi:hypothetical protein
MMQDDTKTKDEQEIESIKEEYNFEKPDYVFIPSGVHKFHQEGFYLICTSCDLSHATFIGKDRVMVGEKDGQPIIKKRKEVFKF